MEYTLENEYLRVTVTQWGAQVKSVLRKCDGVEHIWQGDPSVWKYHSPVLFPYAGQVRGGRTTIRGRTVENLPIHGFARTREHNLLQQTPDSLTLELREDGETMATFPYRFRFLSTFRLEGEKLLHTLTVENTDTEDFSFGIGYHPAFAIPFDENHSWQDYELRFSETESPLCLATPTGLLNGEYYFLGNNIRSIPIEDGMFDGGSHCMVNLRSYSLGLYEKGSGRGVECTIENFPYCLIWSQAGTPRFVCIEPWHSLPGHEQDSGLWSEKAAAATVSPGESWSTTLQTAFLR